MRSGDSSAFWMLLALIEIMNDTIISYHTQCDF